jgi:hypothetical protein
MRQVQCWKVEVKLHLFYVFLRAHICKLRNCRSDKGEGNEGGRFGWTCWTVKSREGTKPTFNLLYILCKVTVSV